MVQHSKQIYRSENGSQWIFAGESSLGSLKFYVNGDLLVKGENAYSINDKQYQYANRKVKFQCTMHPGLTAGHVECDAFVDGEYAANLYFR